MAPVRQRQEVLRAAVDDAQPMFVQLQVADDLGLQQADGVGRGRVAEARMEFLRHASASDHAAPLQNAHAQPRHAEIGRTGEPVMTGTDDDGIEIRHAPALVAAAITLGYQVFAIAQVAVRRHCA